MRIHSVRLLLGLLLFGCGREDANPPSHPYPQDTSYLDRERGWITVTAFPGQIQLWFADGVSGDEAERMIRDHGASVLSTIPEFGYSLAGTNLGEEASFLAVIQSDPRVEWASPHVPTKLASANVFEPDCQEVHARDVMRILTQNSARGNCFNIGSYRHSDGSVTISSDDLLKAIQAHPSELINLSMTSWTGQGTDLVTAQRSYERWLTNILYAIDRLPSNVKDKVVVTIAAGNEGLVLDEILDHLRENPKWDRILRDHVLIVATNQNREFNKVVVPDRDVADVDNPDSGLGTSLGAPYANALIQRAMLKTGVSARTALKAAKKAVAKNSKRLLKSDEIVREIEKLLQAWAGVGYSGAVGALTGAYEGQVYLWWRNPSRLLAEIDVDVPGVKIEYEVSGQDGYSDQGTLETDFLGMTGIPLPPGVYEHSTQAVAIPGGPPPVGAQGSLYTVRVRVAGSDKSAEDTVLRPVNVEAPDWATYGTISFVASGDGRQVVGRSSPEVDEGRAFRWCLPTPFANFQGLVAADADGQVVIPMPEGYSASSSGTFGILPTSLYLVDEKSGKVFEGKIWARGQ